MKRTSDFISYKKSRKKIALFSVYEACSARILEGLGVDALLVGDSLGPFILGYKSTTEVTMDDMIHHTKAARRGAPNSFLIGDMPYEGIAKGPAGTLKSAKRFVAEAHVDAVKIECNASTVADVELVVKNKIPVMAHIGFTPQFAGHGKSSKVRGCTADEAAGLLNLAKKLEKAGVFAIVLECVPAEVSAEITKALRVPTIGIGAGVGCDGQVIVLYDLVGMKLSFKPRFLKRYDRFEDRIRSAATRFDKEVKLKKFPARSHTYPMPEEEIKRFREWLLKR